MRSWWLRSDGLMCRAAPRGVLGLAVLLACSLFGACGGSSKSRHAPATGGAGAAGAGGSGVAGGAESGASGVGAEPGGNVGGTSGEAAGSSGATSGTAGLSGTAGATNATGGQSGNAGAVANGGSSGAASDTGGAAGDGAASAGESSGGAGNECQDLCSESAPACCTQELRCVERMPRCRIDVLEGDVGVVYQYSDLQAEIGTLSGEVEFKIALSFVERAAADPPPAARFELTLAADASTDLAALADVAGQPFRLSCDEQELFFGIVYFRGGAAAIRTPVLHVEPTEDGALVLRLGAWQGAWSFSSDGDDVAELRDRIDRTELRAELCERGILEEIP